MRFASGLLSCRKASAASLAMGNAPTTISGRFVGMHCAGGLGYSAAVYAVFVEGGFYRSGRRQFTTLSLPIKVLRSPPEIARRGHTR
uniref:Uncharacterized protein n=1 Tax=Ixodes ricinus TaxID=34613 RepID=A0A6B0TZ82_IXORI